MKLRKWRLLWPRFKYFFA